MRGRKVRELKRNVKRDLRRETNSDCRYEILNPRRSILRPKGLTDDSTYLKAIELHVNINTSNLR